MIINDSAYMSTLLKDLVSTETIQVYDIARDGVEGLRKITLQKPDVILLDLEMPRMDGVTFIEEMVKRGILIPTILVSSFSQDGAKIVLDALENGAIDFVPISQVNPDGTNHLKETLITKITGAAKCDPYKLVVEKIGTLRPKRKAIVSSQAASIVVTIASSTGGPNIVQTILAGLPADLPAGVLVVQHMPKGFTQKFAERLNEASEITVKEAQEGDLITQGVALVAPGDLHMEVDSNLKIKLINGPKRFGVRPAANVTMVSASEFFGANTVGVTLTGMGHDGAFGMKTIKRRGGKTFAQDEKSSVVFGMAKAAVDLNAVDQLLPPEKMAGAIVEEVKKLVTK
ncbi:chemotaxis protein [Candidatus Nitrosotenuis cloacae]|uniref:Protein-glutamate methylesterase/protein-glutamine glutaminase n=2 Tax=Candidatus Nitrosotenuis cloacae TaxID=1603555 RepID=A0A3G1B4Z9_9ARCH|nr:chemotaxis protein [Candidatus Nitrosotenuis cloacae]